MSKLWNVHAMEYFASKGEQGAKKGKGERRALCVDVERPLRHIDQ